MHALNNHGLSDVSLVLASKFDVDDIDYTLRLSPMEVRRRSRFLVAPMVVWGGPNQTTLKVVGYRPKRVDRRGVSAVIERDHITGLKVGVDLISHGFGLSQIQRWKIFGSHESKYTDCGLMKVRAKAKTAARRELRKELDECFVVTPKKGPNLAHYVAARSERIVQVCHVVNFKKGRQKVVSAGFIKLPVRA